MGSCVVDNEDVTGIPYCAIFSAIFSAILAAFGLRRLRIQFYRSDYNNMYILAYFKCISSKYNDRKFLEK